MNSQKRLGSYRAYARSHPTGSNSLSQAKQFCQQLLETSQKTARGLDKAVRKLLKMKSDSGADMQAAPSLPLIGYDNQEAELLKNRGQFYSQAREVLDSRQELDEIVRKEQDHLGDDLGVDVQAGDELQVVERRPENQFTGDVPVTNVVISEMANSIEQRIGNILMSQEPLRFKAVPPLPIISAEIPQLRGTLLRFFKSYWSLIILYITYLCAVLSELTVAHLNATYLLGFDPFEGWLFAGVIVAISYVFAKILLPQVQRLLGEDKSRLNAFWYSYIIAVIILISSFGFLSYERLQDRALTDEALVTSEELNNLHIANGSYSSGGDSFQDLIDQKQNQLNQILSELTQGQSALEKWAARIALVLAGLIGLITSSILIGAIKIIGTTAKAYQRIKRGQKKLDKLYALDEEILGRLYKAQDMICNLSFQVIKIQVLEEILAMPLSDADFTNLADVPPDKDLEFHPDELGSTVSTQGNPFDLMP